MEPGLKKLLYPQVQVSALKEYNMAVPVYTNPVLNIIPFFKMSLLEKCNNMWYYYNKF